jgi:hypothetical protein
LLVFVMRRGTKRTTKTAGPIRRCGKFEFHLSLPCVAAQNARQTLFIVVCWPHRSTTKAMGPTSSTRRPNPHDSGWSHRRAAKRPRLQINRFLPRRKTCKRASTVPFTTGKLDSQRSLTTPISSPRQRPLLSRQPCEEGGRRGTSTTGTPAEDAEAEEEPAVRRRPPVAAAGHHSADGLPAPSSRADLKREGGGRKESRWGRGRSRREGGSRRLLREAAATTDAEVPPHRVTLELRPSAAGEESRGDDEQ